MPKLRSGVSRRRFLAGTAATFAGLTAPYISRAADRPLVTHGVQSGDVSVDRAVLWSRSDRPSEMLVEIASSDKVHKCAPSSTGRRAA